MPDSHYGPSWDNPLLIMAMDHRESFGRTLCGVRDDKPDAEQRAAMQAAKRLSVAAPVDGFVGFAIGRSIWEDLIADHNQGKISEDETVTRIAGRYLGFASRYCAGRNPS